MENNIKKIVLVGGGYASIWAYRSLVKELYIELISGMAKIVVVCPEDYHFFHGWTAESFTGIVRDENRMSPLEDLFEFAEIIKGKVVSINPDVHTLYIEMNDGSKTSLHYNQLLLGMGSSDASMVEGLSEHAYQLKSHNAYLRAKMRVEFLVNEALNADPSDLPKSLRFIVAGGGLTGVEFAANLAEMLTGLKKQHPILNEVRPIIYLLNSKDEILPGISPRLKRMRRYTEKTLIQQGVIILHNIKMTKVNSQGVYLSDGRFIESRMVVSTIGQTRITIKGTEQMERDGENRIHVNNFLQIKKYHGIWGAGDAVHVQQYRKNNACPSNALWAIKQGEHAGKNMARSVINESLKPFTYKGLGQCASLGTGKGVGELYGLQLTGWMAWIIRWCFFQYFMPLKKIMWREISDWMFLLITRSRRNPICDTRAYGKLTKPEWIGASEISSLAYHN